MFASVVVQDVRLGSKASSGIQQGLCGPSSHVRQRGGSGCAAGVEGVRWHSAGAVRSVDAGLGGKEQRMRLLGPCVQRRLAGSCDALSSLLWTRRRCGVSSSRHRHRSNKSRGRCGPSARRRHERATVNVDDSMIMRYAAICEIPCGQIPCREIGR